MKKSTVIRIVCMVFAAALFCFSAYKIIGIFVENKQGESHYTQLADTVVQMATQPTEGAADALQPEQESAPIAVDFDALKKQNADVVGWIYCENTVINYPVMKSDNYNDYLRRLMTGERNTAGSIFMDYASQADLSCLNTILYGHNMRNDTMFGTFDEYQNQDYYEAHPVMWFLTPNGDYKIELLAGFVTPSESEAYQDFDTVELLMEYVDDAIRKSTFETAADQSGIERVMTMSTCVRGMDTKRYVLVGKLVAVP